MRKHLLRNGCASCCCCILYRRRRKASGSCAPASAPTSQPATSVTVLVSPRTSDSPRDVQPSTLSQCLVGLLGPCIATTPDGKAQEELRAGAAEGPSAQPERNSRGVGHFFSFFFGGGIFWSGQPIHAFSAADILPKNASAPRPHRLRSLSASLGSTITIELSVAAHADGRTCGLLDRLVQHERQLQPCELARSCVALELTRLVSLTRSSPPLAQSEQP